MDEGSMAMQLARSHQSNFEISDYYLYEELRKYSIYHVWFTLRVM